ncbi:unnamed protein product [Triticum turgidum subsp. durum]|uniref:RWP-RK domain-containing protein n=1 Tax=Triticum turgidum subsp. durum TaxID=4567 RepID=A0A9R0Z7A1_TRITD|nr:unnamed protein product [Triticum turgidum subsp. durum]
MPVRDVVSWNTLLAAYSRSSHSHHLAAARRLFDEMPKRDGVTWNTLLSAYVRCGLMGEAGKLFDEMPQRGVTSWNTMVTGFFAAGQVSKALDMFNAMPVKDSASLGTLVSGLAKNGRLHEAEELLTKRLTVTDMDKAVDAYNTLIAAYGQVGRVDDARRLFDMIPRGQNQHQMSNMRVFQRNVVSWNTMMMCYTRTGDVCSARMLFDEMPAKNLESWNTMVAGYAKVSNMQEAEKLFWEMPDPDMVSWNLIIRGFTQIGEVEHARGFFDRMPERAIISWNTMISGYEQNGDYDGTIELFSKMLEVGGTPDRHTFSSVLAACASIPMLPLGVQLHQLIEKSFLPDTATSNALITMYSRGGAITDAEAIFNQMRTQKCLVSWNALIGGYEHHGRATEALQLFEEMRRARVMPTHITFISLLSACGNAGLVSEGWRVFHTMVHEYGIAARIEHYSALVNLIGRHGKLDDALEVINSMPIAPDRSVWGSFLGACTAKKNEPLAHMAAKALSKIDPESSAPYVLIHNLHAREGRWGSASLAREEMERQGVHKHAGYSWIDLHDQWAYFAGFVRRQLHKPKNMGISQATQKEWIPVENIASGLMGQVFGMIVTCLKRRRSSALYPSRATAANHCALSAPLLRRAAVCKSSHAAPCLVPCDTDELDTSFDDDLLRCWEAIEQSDDSTEESGKGLPLLCYGEVNGAASNAMRADRVRSERVLTFELVSQYFYMPITQAARELNVGLTVLKKRCRELRIPRWPHRKLKSLQTLINDVEVLQEAGKANDDGQLRAMVEMLEQERRLLEQRPYVELEEKTKRLRQACFKASYKKRRLLALEPGEASKYY